MASLKARFPADTGSFNGRDAPPGPPNFNNRPNNEPFGFTVRVVVSSEQSGTVLTGEDRRNLYLHHDQDLLPGFPKTLDSDGASSPRLADLDGDNRTELIFGTSDGTVHAMRRDGSELAGWPVRSDPLPLHTGGHAFTSGGVDAGASHGAFLASVAVADLDRDGTPEVIGADMKGKVYAWNADGSLRFKRQTEHAYSGQPLTPHVNVRDGHRYRTQASFIGSPVVADLDGNGGRAEIIAAAMDRHVYAWDADGDPVPGFPVLAVDRSKISAIDAQTHAPTFSPAAGAELNQGAIVDTPAVGDLDGDARPEIVVGTNEEYAAADDGGLNAGTLNAASLAVIAQTGQLDPGNTRLYAIRPDGEPGGPTVGGPSPFLPGWPVKLGIILTEILPVVGEGVTGSPAIGPVTCTSGGSGVKVGASGNAGPAYILNPDGSSCYGQTSGLHNTLQTDFAAGVGKFDTPAIPAVGHATFGDLGGPGPSYLTPATGLLRALDLGVNEYQGGQDFVAAWEPSSGQFRPGFPAVVNDLQFISGPSVADIDGLPGEEVLGGTASLDLFAFNAAGLPAGLKWPKPTADWTVANPALGSFDTQDTDAAARKVVIAMTRAGTLFAYNTDAPACSAGSWPTFHHDLASSGDYRRDATLPGRPYDLANNGAMVTFEAPGDDLLCGTATSYQVVQSDDPITGANFSSAEPIAGAPAPAAAGTTQSVTLPPGPRRFVAIRAVDDQGNVGPIAQIEAGPPGYARPKSATPIYAPLVPAYKTCTSPNRRHASPLSYDSCNPPQRESAELTLGTPDANGKPANSSGALRLVVRPGDPSTPADEADVAISFNVTDVRKSSDLSDYTGELRVAPLVRLTDRDSGSGPAGQATVQEFSFPMVPLCSPTADPAIGATCTLDSTFEAVLPGSVTEGKRAIWELGQVEVSDGGPDGNAATAPNTAFLRQGVFVP